ncbi:protein HGH1 [Artemisia annua]|uniref:Protein HGH1 n=1 Tax=Artemisia annua TaxID=35608 RepID=A0A2U1NUU4_ARTAN|nr:protein HGH1 [Artemisia annua]
MTCPIDMKEAITIVIFAVPRCSDISKLADIQKQLHGMQLHSHMNRLSWRWILPRLCQLRIKPVNFKDCLRYLIKVYSEKDIIKMPLELGSALSLEREPVTDHVIRIQALEAIYLITFQEGWWYLGCRKCNKKVVKESQFVDLEDETKNFKASYKFFNSKFCLDIDFKFGVQDESGTISLSLFNEEVNAMVGTSAFKLCEKYGCKNDEDQNFPSGITIGWQEETEDNKTSVSRITVLEVGIQRLGSISSDFEDQG